MTRYKLYVGDFSTWSPIITHLEVDEKLKKKISTINGLEPDENGNLEITLPEESTLKLSTKESTEMYPNGTSEIPITIPNFKGENEALILFKDGVKLSKDKYNVIADGDNYKLILSPPLDSDSNINMMSIEGQGLSLNGSASQWSEF